MGQKELVKCSGAAPGFPAWASESLEKVDRELCTHCTQAQSGRDKGDRERGGQWEGSRAFFLPSAALGSFPVLYCDVLLRDEVRRLGPFGI